MLGAALLAWVPFLSLFLPLWLGLPSQPAASLEGDVLFRCHQPKSPRECWNINAGICLPISFLPVAFSPFILLVLFCLEGGESKGLPLWKLQSRGSSPPNAKMLMKGWWPRSPVTWWPCGSRCLLPGWSRRPVADGQLQ